MKFIILGAVLALTATASWEYCTFLKVKKIEHPLKLVLFGSSLVCGSFFVSALVEEFSILPVFMLFLMVVLLFVAHFKKVEDALVEVSASIFSLIYIAVPLGMFFFILYDASFHQDGRWWLAYLLIVTKIVDICAYFGGKSLGRSKLAPSISPNKTREGAVIGFLGALLLSLLFSYFGAELSGGRFSLPLIDAIILGGILGVLGQLGDLAESLLKRDVQVKDSNKLPGLGGILDMLDSVLFTVPVIYFYLRIGSV